MSADWTRFCKKLMEDGFDMQVMKQCDDKTLIHRQVTWALSLYLLYKRWYIMLNSV